MKYTHKAAVLTGMAVVLLALSIYLAVSPTMQKRQMLSRQAELLESIEQGGGVDFNDSGEDTEPEPAGSAAITGIGVLSIDSIDLRLPVTDGVTDAQLKVAVGHVPQTASIGGEGNAVIAGHRSYTYGQYFNRLGEVSTGDIIRYESIDGATMAFEVTDILVVPPDDPAAYEQTGESMLTLYTCTPIRTATDRLLIRAMRIVEP